MPMKTTFETKRSPSAGSRPFSRAPSGSAWPGQSPSRSRATIACAAISCAVRLRTSRCVPVWQNEQVSVQPTWLETQSVPRSLSGI